MIALYILAGLILVIGALLAIPASVSVEYRDEVRVALSLLGLRIWQHPKKKKPVKLSDYSPRAAERRRRRETRKKQKALLRKQKKERAKTTTKKQTSPKKKRGLLESVSLIRKIASVILARTAKHTRIDLRRLDIAVATDDAAKTALLFGAVNQAAIGLTELLEQSGNLHIPHNARLSVRADFEAQKSTADVYVIFTLRIWQLIDVAFRALRCFLGGKKKVKKVPMNHVNTSETSN